MLMKNVSAWFVYHYTALSAGQPCRGRQRWRRNYLNQCEPAAGEMESKMQATNHKAKRVYAGRYIYRDHLISDASSVRGRYWGIWTRDASNPHQDDAPGEKLTFEWTLLEAKAHVDRILDDGHSCEVSLCPLGVYRDRQAA